MTLQTVTAGTGADTRINENYDTLSAWSVYGRRHPGMAGLVWGYGGGRWSGFSVTAGTLTLAANSTNYITVDRATGVISTSTATTNWLDTTNHARVYSVVTNTLTATSWQDFRAGSGGLLGGSGGGLSNPMTTDGDMIRGAAAGAPTRIAAGTNGHILTMVGGVPVWAANGGAGSPVVCIPIACSDESTVLTAGTARVTFRMPYAFTLSAVRASLTTAPTGSTLVVDINEGGVSILSTKLSIDATEKTSTTAATAAVISDANLADDAEITIDIDQVGSTIAGAGLKVYLIGVVA